QQSFYFVMKFEFNFNDSVHKAFALSTVQIDTQNPENFGIEYTAADGSRKTPFLLHASISGAIDRNLCAILEHQAMEAKAGKKPALPFWLSPTQVRFMPLNDSFLPECARLAGRVNDAGYRADVDDSAHGVGRKIAEGEKDWVPLMIVVGEKEKAAGKFTPRIRKPEWGKEEPLTIEQVIALCATNSGSEPRGTLPLPMMLSQRPIFRG
ncbi:MAG: His/Gly/Thr/Pro-type tRNA ligase C-terminal domain-containing protein, partial [Candidatus Thermoplasmatota archaeon]